MHSVSVTCIFHAPFEDAFICPGCREGAWMQAILSDVLRCSLGCGAEVFIGIIRVCVWHREVQSKDMGGG